MQLLILFINTANGNGYLYYRFLPESPRWLIMKKKYEKADIVLQQMANVNRRHFPVPFNYGNITDEVLYNKHL